LRHFVGKEFDFDITLSGFDFGFQVFGVLSDREGGEKQREPCT
jgi:hypothetical protein